jgi:gamma-tubulin complex component 3
VSDEAPLSAVFGGGIMDLYHQIFNFLWKLKKVEHALIESWRANMANQGEFAKLRGLKAICHKFNLCHHEMVHFISNIHNYIMLEIESAWKVFNDGLRAAKDLDELVLCQQNFVKEVLDKSMIASEHQDLQKILKKLLGQVYTFTFIKQKFFFQSLLDEASRIKSQNESGLVSEPAANLETNKSVSQESIKQMEKYH